MFCDCILESNYRVLSLHRTKKGAYWKMNQYINNLHNNWNKERLQQGKRYSEEKWFTEISVKPTPLGVRIFNWVELKILNSIEF